MPKGAPPVSTALLIGTAGFDTTAVLHGGAAAARELEAHVAVVAIVTTPSTTRRAGDGCRSRPITRRCPNCTDDGNCQSLVWVRCFRGSSGITFRTCDR